MSHQNPFKSTPSSSSIENTFRMAQVLHKNKKYKESVDAFLKVCLQTEQVLLMNPGAKIEMHWVVFSLGFISDIYAEQSDYNKSKLFRDVQNDFLYLIKNKKENGVDDLEENDSPTPDQFIQLATLGHQYQEIFSSLHKAIDEPDKPPQEDHKELVRRIQEARKKDEEARAEEMIKMLNEAADNKEKELKNSFWKRNLKRLADHPLAFVLIVVLIALSVVVYIKTKPKKKFSIPGGIDAQMAYLEKYVHDFEKKHGKGDEHHHHHHHDL